MSFEFATAGRILFGRGARAQASAIVRTLGGKPLILTGARVEAGEALAAELHQSGVEAILGSVVAEPTVDLIAPLVAAARIAGADVVVGIGGGSVLDAAKAVAALAANPGDPLDYLEVVGRGLPLPNMPLPVVAMPTTAGTGSEVTRNAVLAVPERRVKVSLRSPLMLPRVAIVDPELTYTMSPATTAATGMDALTQLIEPYVSTRANPLTDGFCREGIRLAAAALRRAYADGSDTEARESMALASLLGGLALANAGLGVVHGFAAPIGGMFPAPHGAVCARLLPPAMSTNIAALRTRQPSSPALARYQEVARLLTGNDQATAEDGADWVSGLCGELCIAPLRDYGLYHEDVAEVVEKTLVASSTKANPLALSPEELTGILLQAL